MPYSAHESDNSPTPQSLAKAAILQALGNPGNSSSLDRLSAEANNGPPDTNLVVKTPGDGYYQTIKEAYPGMDPEKASELAHETKNGTNPANLKSGNKDVLSIGDHLIVPPAPYSGTGDRTDPSKDKKDGQATTKPGAEAKTKGDAEKYGTELDRDLAQNKAVTVYIWNESDRTAAQAYVNAALKEYPGGQVKIAVSNNPNIGNGQLQSDGSSAIRYAYNA